MKKVQILMVLLICTASQTLYCAGISDKLRKRKPILDSLINFRVGIFANAFNGLTLRSNSAPSDHLVFTPHFGIGGAVVFKGKFILAGALSFGRYKAVNDFTRSSWINYFFAPAYGLLIKQSGNVSFRNIAFGYQLYNSSKFSIESSLGLGSAIFRMTSSEVILMTPEGALPDNDKLVLRKHYTNYLTELNFRFYFKLSSKLHLNFSSGVFILNRNTAGFRLETASYRVPLLCNQIGLTFKF